MSLSESLYISWQRFCAIELGHPLDMNSIEPGLVSHVVPDGQPPFRCADGTVRKLSMAYELEDLRNEFPN